MYWPAMPQLSNKNKNKRPLTPKSMPQPATNKQNLKPGPPIIKRKKERKAKNKTKHCS